MHDETERDDETVTEQMTDLQTLETTLLAEIGAATDEAALEAVRVSALGKKGSVSERLKMLGGMSPEERQQMGPAINWLKHLVTDALSDRRATLRDTAIAARLETERVDVSLPVRQAPAERGRIHPISQVIDEIAAIFGDLGFDIIKNRYPVEKGRFFSLKHILIGTSVSHAK